LKLCGDEVVVVTIFNYMDSVKNVRVINTCKKEKPKRDNIKEPCFNKCFENFSALFRMQSGTSSLFVTKCHGRHTFLAAFVIVVTNYEYCL